MDGGDKPHPLTPPPIQAGFCLYNNLHNIHKIPNSSAETIYLSENIYSGTL